MCKWDEMSARERDALVAVKVMGWVYEGSGWVECDDRFVGGKSHLRREFYPSTDIGEAWRVVETLRSKGITLDLYVRTKLCTAVVTDKYNANQYREFQELARMSAPTAPEAICLAALRAVGIDTGGEELLS